MEIEEVGAFQGTRNARVVPGKEPQNCQPLNESVAKEKEKDQPLKGSEIEETQVSLEGRKSDLWLLRSTIPG